MNASNSPFLASVKKKFNNRIYRCALHIFNGIEDSKNGPIEAQLFIAQYDRRIYEAAVTMGIVPDDQRLHRIHSDEEGEIGPFGGNLKKA